MNRRQREWDVVPRLAIGPANYAGQATRWAEAVRQHTAADAWSFSREDPLGFGSDRHLEPSSSRVRAGAGITSSVIHGSTHVMIDGFAPLSGGRAGGSVSRDVKDLQGAGRRVALLAHGSDLRGPFRHKRRVEHSWYRGAPPAYVLRSAYHSVRNLHIWKAVDVPLFVSTPDLLWDAPGARWLPLVVDIDAWRAEPLAFSLRPKPRVLHCPSRRRPSIKGTTYIDAVMRSMEREGLIEYVSPARMTNAEMRAEVKNSDVVIDQILGDAYGVTSCEAMAAGRIVITSVGRTRELLPSKLPIFDADPESLERVMRRILREREDAVAVARTGPAYVQSVHGGRKSAEVLGEWLYSTAKVCRAENIGGGVVSS